MDSVDLLRSNSHELPAEPHDVEECVGTVQNCERIIFHDCHVLVLESKRNGGVLSRKSFTKFRRLPAHSISFKFNLNVA